MVRNPTQDDARYLLGMIYTPRPYQLTGADFLAGKRRALLADQMRVGKTPQAIMACDRINAQRVLVTCPAIATYQWVSQWADWSDRSPARIMDGEWLPQPNWQGVAVASYNRALMNLDFLRKQRWDVYIPDEAHFAKTPTAQRTAMVYGKDGLGWAAERLWALTGTPAPNHAGEMWPILRAFGAVKCTYEEFVSYYCIYDAEKARFHGNKPQHLEELRRLIAPFTLRRTLREVAPDMPRVAYNFFVVEPTGLDLNTDDPAQVREQDRIDVAMAKIPTLADEIEMNLSAQEYQQTVVFGYHVDPLEALADELFKRKIDAATLTGRTSPRKRQDIQAAHKLGILPVTIAQIIAAGTAIDLSGAQHGYFLELDYVPDNNAQAAHRLVNLQTQLPVSMDIMTWPGTQDDAVQRRIIKKVSTAVFKS